MIALDLGIFPEKEQQMMDYIEEQNQLYEQEYEQEIQESENKHGGRRKLPYAFTEQGISMLSAVLGV